MEKRPTVNFKLRSGGGPRKLSPAILVVLFVFNALATVPSIDPARLELHGLEVKLRDSQGRLISLRDGRYRLEDGVYLEVRRGRVANFECSLCGKITLPPPPDPRELTKVPMDDICRMQYSEVFGEPVKEITLRHGTVGSVDLGELQVGYIRNGSSLRWITVRLTDGGPAPEPFRVGQHRIYNPPRIATRMYCGAEDSRVLERREKEAREQAAKEAEEARMKAIIDAFRAYLNKKKQ